MSTDTPDTPPRPHGRPSEVTDLAIDEVLSRLSVGESLRQICADAHLPDRSSIFRRLHQDARFQQAYAKAREIGA